MEVRESPSRGLVASPRTSSLLPAAAVALAAVGGAAVVLADILAITTPGRARSSDPNLSSTFLFAAVPMFTLLAVGLLLSLKRLRNPVGWLISVSMVAFGFLLLGTVYGSRLAFAHDLPDWPQVPLLILTTAGWSTSFPVLLVMLPLVFPDGHLVSPRWRLVVRLAVATIVFTIITSLAAAIPMGPTATTPPPNLATYELVMGTLDGPVSGLFMLGLIVAAVVSLVLRYRGAGSELRHQLKWFVAAMVLAGLAVIPEFAGSNVPGAGLAMSIGLTAVPLSIAVAVFRYRLYDIDVIISRTLVYGALAAFITAIYVGIVVGLGSIVGSGGKPNIVLSIVATAVVAVGFQPARERLQRIANRLVYGRRATPYEVLAEFSGRVGETLASDEVLPRMARVLREGTAAEHATVWLRSGTTLRPAATAPETMVGFEPLPLRGTDLPNFPEGTTAVAVRHRGDLLGALSVVKRAGETLTPIEEQLLDHLAGQAGLLLRNVSLSSTLQARLQELRGSRQRLVAAQDAERRRLERNLHDGAQQHLVAMKVKLGLAEMMTGRDPDKAAQLIEGLEADADEALETLRDTARGIYPPVLAERGLAAALEVQAQRSSIPVAVHGGAIGRYPEDVEVAAYFCVLEALQNVQKYAGARAATVTLEERDGSLNFVVEDDGAGFDPGAVRRGSGMSNMADRVDALGGDLRVTSSPGSGTRVAASIPIPGPASGLRSAAAAGAA